MTAGHLLRRVSIEAADEGVVSVFDRERTELYVDDFKKKVIAVDTAVFGAVGKPRAGVMTVPERLNGLTGGIPVGKFSSILFQMPEELCGGAVPLRERVDFYILWRNEIAVLLEQFARSHIESISDADLDQFWFINAIALVRLRVLRHPDWFPKARRRDLRSIAKHCNLIGPELFELRPKYDQLTKGRVGNRNHARGHADSLKKSARAVASDKVNFDIYLTQYLVVSALMSGREFIDALQYISND